MAKPSRSSDSRVQLTDRQLELIDRLATEEKLAHRYRRHAARARKIREQLSSVFGDSRAAVHLKSRRGFLKLVEEREYDPLPAKTVEVVKFEEFPIWDLS